MAEDNLQSAGGETLPLEDNSEILQKTPAHLLLLGALGIVYGDIGTSPIYAFRVALHASGQHHQANYNDILGIISLIFWSLVLVVTVKYILFVLRADNNGEGGILSLMTLARKGFKSKNSWVLVLGVIGASLFFGDAVITPAVSVLSALEGLEVVQPELQPFIVPITIVVLLVLFSVQKYGTGKVSTIFGPVMLVWFLSLGIFGLIHIFDDLSIFSALLPTYAIFYIVENLPISFTVVGAVFLAVTGAEALYADLGHFGYKPIVRAWLWIVFPCLILNYLGQGAFILKHGRALENPFFQMLPSWALLPMVLLATLATVIASQAVITGAYSLARQAVQLNILPRMAIMHTSETTIGQIYMPRVNFLLAVVVVILVAGFEQSTNLAAAYGISVTGNMLVTTALLFIVMARVWQWRMSICITAALCFLVFDLLFFSANIIKIFDGGWASVGLATIIVLTMWTWIRGSRKLFNKNRKNEVALDFIIKKMERKPPFIVPGTAVYLTGDPKSAPSSLMHSLKHYKVLHEMNVILTVTTVPVPRVPIAERMRISQYSKRFMQVTLTFGYMEQPNIPRALVICRRWGWNFDIMSTSFFLSRRSIKLSEKSNMPLWQDKYFVFLARTASDATDYFQIPSGRVVEIGTQITI